MAYIHSNVGWIARTIKKLETTGLSIQESVNILENSEVKLSVLRGETDEKIYRKF
jgi:hypothetical protein